MTFTDSTTTNRGPSIQTQEPVKDFHTLNIAVSIEHQQKTESEKVWGVSASTMESGICIVQGSLVLPFSYLVLLSILCDCSARSQRMHLKGLFIF